MAVLIVGVQDRDSWGFRAATLEQNSLGGKILIHGVVIIEMIAGQIGEHRHIEWDPVNPLLRQSMRGDFHHRLGRSAAIRFREHTIQFKRFRGGVRGG